MPEWIEFNNHAVDASLMRKSLEVWGQKNFRQFPWRMTRDSYKILMSEVMLHRTQAKQVVPIYETFISQYPLIENLFNATKEDLHNVLYSIGLRWRIDLIYEMGKELINRFNGMIPENKAELLSLPGVSEYVAGAVRCFAWNLPEVLADTNTVRVAGRLFGLTIKDSSRRNRQFREILIVMLDPEKPRDYNYALIDLADKVCMKKQEPLCPQCPLESSCLHARQREN